MPSKKELKQILQDRMVDVIVEHTGLSDEDAVQTADNALGEMGQIILERQEQLRKGLRMHVSTALCGAFPKFDDPTYKSLLEKLETLATSRFEQFRSAIFLEQNYPRFEKNFIVAFLSAVPHATGTSTALARDLMADHLIHAFDSANLRLSIGEVHYVRNFFDTIFTIFCGLSKMGLEDVAEEIYDEREKLLLNGLRSSLHQAKNNELVDESRRQCDTVLRNANLKLTEYQRMNVCDQLQWLFRDYVNAPVEERDQVYTTGEERIIISTFNPAGFGEPASSSSID